MRVLVRNSPAPRLHTPVPTDALPRDPKWLCMGHEIKHDGYRLIARRDGGRVRLYTRRGYDWSGKYLRIVEALRSLRIRSSSWIGKRFGLERTAIGLRQAILRAEQNFVEQLIAQPPDNDLANAIVWSFPRATLQFTLDQFKGTTSLGKLRNTGCSTHRPRS
jgi:hypothetical protein